MQRKIFRIEQMMPPARSAAPVTTEAAPRHAVEEREALAALVERGGGNGDGALQRDLTLVHDMIARHKRELTVLIGNGKERRMVRAAGELNAAVEGMDKATQGILKSAESIDDSAKTLVAAIKGDYERGLAQDIQEQVVQIYEACNFQDLAGQRIGKVMTMLSALDQQITAMLARCERGEVAPCAMAGSASALINGPKLDGDSGHASQHDIDAMFR